MDRPLTEMDVTEERKVDRERSASIKNALFLEYSVDEGGVSCTIASGKVRFRERAGPGSCSAKEFGCCPLCPLLLLVQWSAATVIAGLRGDQSRRIAWQRSD